MVGRALASVVAIVAAVDAQYGPYQHWWNVAMSADGQTVVGLTGGTNSHVGYPLPAPNVFRSTDSGTHFTQVSDDGDLNACSSGTQTQCTWMGVSCSADGLFVAAVSDSGFLYWGDFPSGGWARSSSPVLSYKALVVRANQLYAISNGAGSTSSGYIIRCPVSPLMEACDYVQPSEQQWNSIASSSDGKRVAATSWDECSGGGGRLYLSNNSGTAWSPVGSPPGDCFMAPIVAMSRDGQTLVVVENSYRGKVKVSADFGATWTADAASPTIDDGQTTGFIAATCSADGGVIAVAEAFGAIYISYDHGGSWEHRFHHVWWSSLASSSDGSILMAASQNYPASGANTPTYLWRSIDSGATWFQAGFPNPPPPPAPQPVTYPPAPPLSGNELRLVLTWDATSGIDADLKLQEINLPMCYTPPCDPNYDPFYSDCVVNWQNTGCNMQPSPGGPWGTTDWASDLLSGDVRQGESGPEIIRFRPGNALSGRFLVSIESADGSELYGATGLRLDVYSAMGMIKSIPVPAAHASPPETCGPDSWHPLLLNYAGGVLTLNATWPMGTTSAAARRLDETEPDPYTAGDPSGSCPIPWARPEKPLPPSPLSPDESPRVWAISVIGGSAFVVFVVGAWYFARRMRQRRSPQLLTSHKETSGKDAEACAEVEVVRA